MQPFRPPGQQQGFRPFNPAQGGGGQQQQQQQQTGGYPPQQYQAAGPQGGMGMRPPQSAGGPPGATYPPNMSGPPRSMGPPGAARGYPQGPPGNHGMGMSQGPPRGPPTNPQGPPRGMPTGPPTSSPQSYGAPPGQPMSSPQGPPRGMQAAGPPRGMQAPMSQPAGPPRGMQPPMSQPAGPPRGMQQMGQAPAGYGHPPQMRPSGPPAPRGMPPPPTAAAARGPPAPGNMATQGPPTGSFAQMNLGGKMPPPQQSPSQQQPPPQMGGYQQQQQPGGYQQQQYGGQSGYGAQTPQQPMQQAVLSDADLAAQCDPKYMRMSVNSIPYSQEHASKSNLPLGVVISPMATSIDGEDDDLEVVNFGASGVIRCKRCRSYVNPFVQWVDNGRRWRCNFCGTSNDVPSSYFCHLGADQQRTDKQERPELRSGSVEIVAPAEYMMRPPQPPVYVFVIDVSVTAIQSGMFNTCIDTIKETLDDLPGAPRTRVGFVTYDCTVHFYNLKSTLNQPQIMVVPDISDLFIPVPDDLLVNLSESRHVIDALIDMLPSMHGKNPSSETALGPAIRAAFRIMSSIGGKMCVFQHSLPSLGQGQLKHRENPRLLGTEKEHTLLNPVDTFYRQNAIEFSRQQVSVDTFLFSSQYIDLATIGSLSKYSAGQVFYYPGFAGLPSQTEKFRNELNHCLTRETGWEAVMRVRCTVGMRLANFYGNAFMRGTDLLALPNCNADSTFAIEMAHSDALLSASVVCVQAALLYTTSCGERRIRVHTMAAPVTKLYAEIFRSADCDTMCNLLAKNSLEIALKTSLDAARMKLQKQCVDILRAYRNSGAYGMQQQQQINLPESLQLLPLYVMALMKNPSFRGGTDVRPDERAFYMYELNNMPVCTSRAFIYPRLFSLHDMTPECGLPVPVNKDESEVLCAGPDKIRLPAPINLSVERLRSDGVFLLEDSVKLYLWIGQASSSAILSSLLGVNSLEGVDCTRLALIDPKDDLSRRIHNIIQAIRQERRPFMDLMIIGEHNPAEVRFFWRLVEDRASFNGGSYSYAEYLGNLNRLSQGGQR